MEDPNALISFEIRKINGRHNVIFPEELPPSKIIYFPNGTYLVSDTISYSMREFRNILSDLRHLEMNAQIRFMGESMEGVTDDTEAIRAAMNCGKPTVYFNAGRYLIDGVIERPAHVRRVNFMYGDLASGPNLLKMADTGAFKVVGETDEPQWPIVVREIRKDEVRELKKDDMPIRYLDSVTIPLYVGKSK